MGGWDSDQAYQRQNRRSEQSERKSESVYCPDQSRRGIRLNRSDAEGRVQNLRRTVRNGYSPSSSVSWNRQEGRVREHRELNAQLESYDSVFHENNWKMILE